MSFTDPKTNTVWNSDKINANASASHLFYRIRWFFRDRRRYSADPDVVRVMYNADGEETTSTSEAQKYVYEIRLRKRITGYSFTNYSTTTFGSIASTITVFPPNSDRGTQSSAPLAGRFILKCPDEDGVFQVTPSRGMTEWEQGVQVMIDDDITIHRGRVWVTKNHYGNRDNHY